MSVDESMIGESQREKQFDQRSYDTLVFDNQITEADKDEGEINGQTILIKNNSEVSLDFDDKFELQNLDPRLHSFAPTFTQTLITREKS